MQNPGNLYFYLYAMKSVGHGLSTRDFLRKREDGILAMVLDLALQFAGTTSVYVAAFVSLQDMYQLSAAAAALPQFSSFALGVGSWALHRSKKYRSLVVWCICHFFCLIIFAQLQLEQPVLQQDSEVETNHFLCIADGSARLCGAFGGRRFGWQTSLRRVHTPYACDDRSECHATRFAVSAEAVNVVMTESVGKMKKS